MTDSDVRGLDRSRILDVLQSGQFSPGPYCLEFERRFAWFIGRRYAVFVNSGTDALRLCLLAMKEFHSWPDGAKVLVPAVTFPATLNIVVQAGLTPYLLDANPQLIVPETIPSDVVAIIPVHLFGRLAPMEAVMDLALKYNLKILEDSCEMLGENAGGYGDCAAFSTYQCHHLQTGVGGFAVTGERHLHEIIRSLANHGRDPAYLPGFRAPELSPELLEKRFRFVRPGYSARATEFQAALGLGQLERYEQNLARRRLAAGRMIAGLAPFEPDLELPPLDPRHTYFAFPILIRPGSKLKKSEFVWQLEQAGIETRDLMPIVNQPAFQKYVVPGMCPKAEALLNRSFYIPCHAGLTEDDTQHIVNTFTQIFTQNLHDFGALDKT